MSGRYVQRLPRLIERVDIVNVRINLKKPYAVRLRDRRILSERLDFLDLSSDGCLLDLVTRLYLSLYEALCIRGYLCLITSIWRAIDQTHDWH
jgi:hypothetical protein